MVPIPAAAMAEATLPAERRAESAQQAERIVREHGFAVRARNLRKSCLKNNRKKP
jgi:hypothetical protein